jgi:hypothetical protein
MEACKARPISGNEGSVRAICKALETAGIELLSGEDGGLGVKARDNDDERHSVRHQSGNERDVARETIELSCSRSRRLEAQVVSLALKEGACQTKGLPVGRPFFAFREMSIVQCSNETDIDTF